MSTSQGPLISPYHFSDAEIKVMRLTQNNEWYDDRLMDALIEHTVEEQLGNRPRGKRYLLNNQSEEASQSYHIAIGPAICHTTSHMYCCLDKTLSHDTNAWIFHLNAITTQTQLNALKNLTTPSIDDWVRIIPAWKNKFDAGVIRYMLNLLQKSNFDLIQLNAIKAEQYAHQTQQADVFDEVIPELKNNGHAAKILFPFAEGAAGTTSAGSHWTTLEIIIHKTNLAFQVIIKKHDPFGKGKLSAEAFEKIKAITMKRIGEINTNAIVTVQSENSPYHRRQASGDGSSCGPITLCDLHKRALGQTLNRNTAIENDTFHAKEISAIRTTHRNLYEQRCKKLHTERKTGIPYSSAASNSKIASRILVDEKKLLSTPLISHTRSRTSESLPSPSTNISSVTSISIPSLDTPPASKSHARNNSAEDIESLLAKLPSPNELELYLDLSNDQLNELNFLETKHAIDKPKKKKARVKFKEQKVYIEPSKKLADLHQQYSNIFSGNPYYGSGLAKKISRIHEFNLDDDTEQKQKEIIQNYSKLLKLQYTLEQIALLQEKRHQEELAEINHQLHNGLLEQAHANLTQHNRISLPRVLALHGMAEQERADYIDVIYSKLKADAEEEAKKSDKKRLTKHVNTLTNLASLERTKHLQAAHLYQPKFIEAQAVLKEMVTVTSPKEKKDSQEQRWAFINAEEQDPKETSWIKKQLAILKDNINVFDNLIIVELQNLFPFLIDKSQKALKNKTGFFESIEMAYEKWKQEELKKDKIAFENQFNELAKNLRIKQQKRFLESAIVTFKQRMQLLDKSESPHSSLKRKALYSAKILLTRINLITDNHKKDLPSYLLPKKVSINELNELENLAKEFVRSELLGETPRQTATRQSAIEKEWLKKQNLPWIEQREAIKEFYFLYKDNFDKAVIAKNTNTTNNINIKKQAYIAAENLQLVINLMTQANRFKAEYYQDDINSHQENVAAHQHRAAQLIEDELTNYKNSVSKNNALNVIQQAHRLKSLIMLYEETYGYGSLSRLVSAHMKSTLNQYPELNDAAGDEYVAIKWAECLAPTNKEMIAFWKNTNISFFRNRREELLKNYIQDIYKNHYLPHKPAHIAGIILYRLEKIGVKKISLPPELLQIQQELTSQHASLASLPNFNINIDQLIDEDMYFTNVISTGIKKLNELESRKNEEPATRENSEWLLFGSLDDLEDAAKNITEYIDSLEKLKESSDVIKEQLQGAKSAQQRIINSMLTLIKEGSNKPNFNIAYKEKWNTLFILGIEAPLLLNKLLDPSKVVEEKEWQNLHLLAHERITQLFDTFDQYFTKKPAKIDISIADPLAQIIANIRGLTSAKDRQDLRSNIMNADPNIREKTKRECIKEFEQIILGMQETYLEKTHILPFDEKTHVDVNPLKTRLMALHLEAKLQPDPITKKSWSLYETSITDRLAHTEMPEYNLSNSSKYHYKKQSHKTYFIHYIAKYGSDAQRDKLGGLVNGILHITKNANNNVSQLPRGTIPYRHTTSLLGIGTDWKKLTDEFGNLASAFPFSNHLNIADNALTQCTAQINKNSAWPIDGIQKYKIRTYAHELKYILQSYESFYHKNKPSPFKILVSSQAKEADRFFQNAIYSLRNEIHRVKECEEKLGTYFITHCSDMLSSHDNPNTYKLSRDKFIEINQFMSTLSNQKLKKDFEEVANPNTHYALAIKNLLQNPDKQHASFNSLEKFYSKYAPDPSAIKYFHILLTAFDSIPFQAKNPDETKQFEAEFAYWMTLPQTATNPNSLGYISTQSPFYKLVRNAILIDRHNPKGWLKSVALLASSHPIKNMQDVRFFELMLTAEDMKKVASSVQADIDATADLFDDVLHPEKSPLIPENAKLALDFKTTTEKLNSLIHFALDESHSIIHKNTVQRRLGQIFANTERFVTEKKAFTGVLNEPLENSAHIILLKIANATLQLAQINQDNNLKVRAERLIEIIITRCLTYFQKEESLHLNDKYVEQLQLDIPNFNERLSPWLLIKLQNIAKKNAPNKNEKADIYIQLLLKYATYPNKIEGLFIYLDMRSSDLSAEQINFYLQTIVSEENRIQDWLNKKADIICSPLFLQTYGKERTNQELIKLHDVAQSHGNTTQKISIAISLIKSLIENKAKKEELQNFIDDLYLNLPSKHFHNEFIPQLTSIDPTHSFNLDFIKIYGSLGNKCAFFREKLSTLINNIKNNKNDQSSIQKIIQLFDTQYMESEKNSPEWGVFKNFLIAQMQDDDIHVQPYFLDLYHLTQRYLKNISRQQSVANKNFIRYMLAGGQKRIFDNLTHVYEKDFVINETEAGKLVAILKNETSPPAQWSANAQLLAELLSGRKNELTDNATPVIANAVNALNAQREKWLQDITNSTELCNKHANKSKHLHVENIAWLREIIEQNHTQTLSPETQLFVKNFKEKRLFIDDNYPNNIKKLLFSLMSILAPNDNRLSIAITFFIDNNTNNITSSINSYSQIIINDTEDNLSKEFIRLKKLLIELAIQHDNSSYYLTLNIVQAQLEQLVQHFMRHAKDHAHLQEIIQLIKLMPDSIRGIKNTSKTNILQTLSEPVDFIKIRNVKKKFADELTSAVMNKTRSKLKLLDHSQLNLLLLLLDKNEKENLQYLFSELKQELPPESPVLEVLNKLSALFIPIQEGFSITERIKNKDQLLIEIENLKPVYTLAHYLEDAPPLTDATIKLIDELGSPNSTALVEHESFWQQRIEQLLHTNQITHSDLATLITRIGTPAQKAALTGSFAVSDIIRHVFDILTDDNKSWTIEESKLMEKLKTSPSSSDEPSPLILTRAHQRQIHVKLGQFFNLVQENFQRIKEEEKTIETTYVSNKIQYSQKLKHFNFLCHRFNYTPPELPTLLAEAKSFLQNYYHPTSPYFLGYKKDNLNKIERQRQSNLLNAHLNILRELGGDSDKQWCNRLRANILVAYYMRGATFDKRHASSQSDLNRTVFRYNIVEQDCSHPNLAEFLSRKRKYNSQGISTALLPGNSFSVFCRKEMSELSLYQLTRATYENKLLEIRDKYQATIRLAKITLLELASINPSKDLVRGGTGIAVGISSTININALPFGYQRDKVQDILRQSTDSQLLIFLEKGATQAKANGQIAGLNAFKHLIDLTQGHIAIQKAIQESSERSFSESCTTEIREIVRIIPNEFSEDLKPIYYQADNLDQIRLGSNVRQEKENYILHLLNSALGMQESQSHTPIQLGSVSYKFLFSSAIEQINSLIVPPQKLSPEFINHIGQLFEKVIQKSRNLPKSLEVKVQSSSITTSENNKTIERLLNSGIFTIVCPQDPSGKLEHCKQEMQKLSTHHEEKRAVDRFKQSLYEFHKNSLKSMPLTLDGLNSENEANISTFISLINNPNLALTYQHGRMVNHTFPEAYTTEQRKELTDFFDSLHNLFILIHNKFERSNTNELTANELILLKIYLKSHLGEEVIAKTVNNFIQTLDKKDLTPSDILFIINWIEEPTRQKELFAIIRKEATDKLTIEFAAFTNKLIQAATDSISVLCKINQIKEIKAPSDYKNAGEYHADVLTKLKYSSNPQKTQIASISLATQACIECLEQKNPTALIYQANVLKASIARAAKNQNFETQFSETLSSLHPSTESRKQNLDAAWTFIEYHLLHIPIHLASSLEVTLLLQDQDYWRHFEIALFNIFTMSSYPDEKKESNEITKFKEFYATFQKKNSPPSIFAQEHIGRINRFLTTYKLPPTQDPLERSRSASHFLGRSLA
jgi:hypothetical protein